MLDKYKEIAKDIPDEKSWGNLCDKVYNYDRDRDRDRVLDKKSEADEIISRIDKQLIDLEILVINMKKAAKVFWSINEDLMNEDLTKLIETQIEEDAIEQIKQGIYEGEDISSIILDNLDELSVEELTKILENYTYYSNGAYNLFPSICQGEVYPIKLAEALAKSSEAESTTGLYNIFYANRNVADFSE